MPTFVQTPIPTYTQATMLTFTPPVAPNLFFFYNADHNNSLYSMDSNQIFAFVSADEDCRCEIAESWMCAINTALKNNQMTPTEYAAALAEGITVSDNNGILSVGPNFASVISLIVSPTTQDFLAPTPDPVQLTYTLLPTNADQRVVWTTSDATKVTVTQQGAITAIATGTATITVISVADPTKTATCLVTVS